jgi:hypothetical protein
LFSRCVNADPNYGSVWFHCREQPNDVPTVVLRGAMQRLVHELTATQKIYVRALLHFVRRCLLQCGTLSEADRSAGALEGSPSRSYSSLAPRRRSPTDAATQQGSSGAADAGAVVSKSLDGLHAVLGSPARGDSNSTFKSSQLNTSTFSDDEARSQGRTPAGNLLATRAVEVLQDIAAVEERLVAQGWPGFSEVHLLPLVEVDGGSLFTSADFVTGMIEMNRDLCNPSLPDEAKRKHLFGSDQIVS